MDGVVMQLPVRVHVKDYSKTRGPDDPSRYGVYAYAIAEEGWGSTLLEAVYDFVRNNAFEVVNDDAFARDIYTRLIVE